MDDQEEDEKELQLLPSPASSSKYRSTVSDHRQFDQGLTTVTPSLDLQLSISVRPIIHHPIIQSPCNYASNVNNKDTRSCVEALKWQAAEQMRLAAIEKAYAERVRELTKREMELAQAEFTSARLMWERARDDVEKAERMKQRATNIQIDSTCMEITCQSCSQRFRPR